MFACLYAPPAPVCHPPGASSSHREALVAIAQAFVPRFDVPRDDLVMLEIDGLRRVLGEPRQIGEELRRAAADRGLAAHVAVASTRTAAWLLAHARAGLTCLEPGGEAAALAPLPIGVLRTLTAAPAATPSPSMLAKATDYPDATFQRWGIATLGDLAALPAAALSERLGQAGLAWQRLARGLEPAAPMVPWKEDIRFHASLELEWPIDGLEPLSFVLGRLLDPLAADLERRDRAAAVLHLRLGLVTKTAFTRALRLPAPIRDPRVLRTLLRLDLEAHPPEAGIEVVTIDIEPAPGRIVQESLLERARPAPEQLTTLLARLTALMGESRCGAPALVDSHRPGAFGMKPFSDPGSRPTSEVGPSPASDQSGLRPRSPKRLRREGGRSPVSLFTALRRFRRPIAVRVGVEQGCPAQVIVDRAELRGGRVERCAGPWRTSGAWWEASGRETRDSGLGEGPARRHNFDRNAASPVRSDSDGCAGGGAPAPLNNANWNRDEWDIALADGTVCRLFQDRDTRQWFLDGVMD